MKELANKETLAKSLTIVQEFANQNYVDGMQEGFNIAIQALEKQVEMQTTGVGSSTVWADWLKYNKQKLLGV